MEVLEIYVPFIDETIYFPKAYYKIAKRNGNKWNWEIKLLELEKCNITKFNKNTLDNLYCLKI